MRKSLAVFLILLFASTLSAQLKEGDMIAICGDSITEQKIYSVMMEDYFIACQPQMHLTAMNHGWSGQSTWDFSARMQDDTLRYQPTVATTCFGMNDGGYAALTPERTQRFRTSTQQIIDQFKRFGVRTIVLGSSSPVDTKTFNRPTASAEVYNKTLAQLRDIDKEIAEQNHVIFADVYTPMLEVMGKAKAKYGASYAVAGIKDGIHPEMNGHLVMAYAMLKALGCDGNIGTIKVDLAANTADATAGHTIQSIKEGTIQIESTRYPFCFTGDPAVPNSTRGIIEFVPFNQDLNRLMLIVTHPPAQTMKVTWGAQSKTFTAAQLAAGINLAAEFLDNPFSDFFAAVDTSVRQQQQYENTVVKGYIHNLPQYMSLVPQDGATKLQEVADLMAKERTTAQTMAIQQVIPVKHTIKIEKADATTAPSTASGGGEMMKQ